MYEDFAILGLSVIVGTVLFFSWRRDGLFGLFRDSLIWGAFCLALGFLFFFMQIAQSGLLSTAFFVAGGFCALCAGFCVFCFRTGRNFEFKPSSSDESDDSESDETCGD